MIRKNQRTLNILNQLLDVLLNAVAFVIAFILRYIIMDGTYINQPFGSHVLAGIVNALVCLVIYTMFHLYEPKRRTLFTQDISIVVRANIVNILLLGVFMYFIRAVDFSRLMLGFYFILSTGFILFKHGAMRALLRHYRSGGYNAKMVLVVGNNPMSAEYVRQLRANPQLGYRPGGYITGAPGQQENHLGGARSFGDVSQLEEALDSGLFDEVVVALDDKEMDYLPAALKACNRQGIRYSVIPPFSRYIFSAAAPVVETIGNVQLFDFCASPLDNTFNKMVKRAPDIVLSALALVILSPVFLVAAVGIKLTSPGPVFFNQKRVGLNKKTFNMYKFRSMRVNDAEDTAWSTKGDNRKTKFGQFLRKTSIDELPQLMNVLLGDMSLIGPRPEIPYHVDHFKDEIPYYMARHQIRPGMTGWAQVNGYRGDTSITERINHDLYYIYNWSFLFDVRIFFKTISAG